MSGVEGDRVEMCASCNARCGRMWHIVLVPPPLRVADCAQMPFCVGCIEGTLRKTLNTILVDWELRDLNSLPGSPQARSPVVSPSPESQR